MCAIVGLKSTLSNEEVKPMALVENWVNYAEKEFIM